MMSATEVVKAGLTALEQGDFRRVDENTADDFVFSGPLPKPVGKREFLGLQQALRRAFPDWKFNASGWQENGNVVTADIQITGTHTADLKIPVPGIPEVPASMKRISLPKQKIAYTVKEGKLAKLETAPSPTAGVPGILGQLGVKMPNQP